MKRICIFLATLIGMANAEEFKTTKPLNLSDKELAYFVSFSIPEKQLVAVMKEAESYNVPIYLNGLINNDINATAKAMLYLARKYDVKGVLVDPTRFNYYQITAVPALAKKCGNKSDVIFGNTNIKQLLEIMKEEGDCKW